MVGSRFRSGLRRWVLGLALMAIFLGCLPLLWRFFVLQTVDQQIYSLESIPATPVAIVFGAGIGRGGGLSLVLRDRMDVAIALYKSGRVQKLLLSGDNRFVNYDEPSAMRDYALSRGVKDEDIQPDFGGRRTYDSCYRAKHIFLLDSATLVTQQFHLPRALFTCSQLGMDAVGVASDLHRYRDAEWMMVREVAATAQSAWDIIRSESPPVMGEAIPLFD